MVRIAPCFCGSSHCESRRDKTVKRAPMRRVLLGVAARLYVAQERPALR
jgi:hypothetical protein